MNNEKQQPAPAAEQEWSVIEPRQITGSPFKYYGYVGKLDASGHLITGTLRSCCDKAKHQGRDAANECAAKKAEHLNAAPSPAQEKPVEASVEIRSFLTAIINSERDFILPNGSRLQHSAANLLDAFATASSPSPKE